ncbi:MAG TPA: PAS domain S-box protein [Mucilaginibacter sp.]|nr:PAS domain S-box protein [Mucilaginibacter sp.]
MAGPNDAETYSQKDRPSFFDSIYTNLPVAIYTCNKSGFITSFNHAAVTLWGRTPEIGKDLWCGSWKIFYPDGRPMALVDCPMALTLKTGVAVTGQEIIVERPDGTRLYIMPNPVPIYDEEGEMVGAMNTLIDLTGQKERESIEARLAAIVQTSDDAIISKTLEGMITTWNHAAEKMYGYTREEAVGQHISLIIPKDRLSEEDIIIDKIKNGERVDHFETLRVAKDGRFIPVSLTISPIKSASGAIIGASKIARDITKAKVAEEKMIRYTEEIKRHNAKKDEFIGVASHELKTPVTSLKGYLQIFENQLPDSDRNKIFIRKAVQQVNKLSSLISDLLDVSRIETGKFPLSVSEFDMKQLLTDVLELTQYSSRSHRICFDCGEEAVMVSADKQRIEQVIINLLSNAIKYSPDADKVNVSLSVGDNKAVVSVQDFGMGISPEQQSRIFSRFYRVEELAAHITGMGIGLYISKEIMFRHKGDLRLVSEPGKGSTFSFELPLQQH